MVKSRALVSLGISQKSIRLLVEILHGEYLGSLSSFVLVPEKAVYLNYLDDEEMSFVFVLGKIEYLLRFVPA